MLVPALGFVMGFAVCYVWTLARRRELLARLVDEAAETVAQAWAWKNRSLEAAARALGWDPDCEELQRFADRLPRHENDPAYLCADGRCVASMADALISWQVCQPETLKAARAAHRQALAAAYTGKKNT